jgi:hypothetical protein
LKENKRFWKELDVINVNHLIKKLERRDTQTDRLTDRHKVI